MAEKRRIETRVHKEIYEKILNNEKFDLRLKIFECEVGDILVLIEFDWLTKDETGRYIEKEIKSILPTAVQFYPQTQEEKHNFQTLCF